MKAVRRQIIDFLDTNGRSTPAQIANGIGYSTSYTRQEAKALRSDDKIKGEKSRYIPAVIIQGDYRVITNDRDYLLDLVRTYAPHRLDYARSLSVEDLQKFIRNEIADQEVGGQSGWEFWI